MTAHTDYHADRSRLSASALKLFLESPFLFRLWEQGLYSKEPSEAMKAGTRLHEMFFQQERSFVVIPEDAPNKPTKSQVEAKKPSEETVEAINWWFNFSTDNNDKDFITSREWFDLFRQTVASEKAFAEIYEAPGQVEQRIDFDIGGVPCKAKPDKVIPGSMIFDLKKCQNASQRAFEKDAYKFNYHLQAAFYRRAWHAKTGEWLPFIFGAVEAKPRAPGIYFCQGHRATDAFLADGERELQRLLSLLKDCREKDKWPQFHDEQDADGFVALDVPKYKQTFTEETQETEQ